MIAPVKTAALLTSAAVLLLFAAPMIHAADGSAPDERGPQFGDPMKDAPFVPTPPAVVDRMLEMARIGPNDRLIDLGSGDGRIVIAAAKRFGARGLGIEHSAELVADANATAKREGVAHLARFERADLFETDLSGVSVVALYLLPEMNVRLRPKLLALTPGTRIVAHEFGLGDWQPDERAMAAGRNALLWIVPSQIEGDWTIRGPRESYRMRIRQRYQMFRGTVDLVGARAGTATTLIETGRVNGTALSFSFFDGRRVVKFVGSVHGDRMSGAIDGERAGEWSGARIR